MPFSIIGPMSPEETPRAAPRSAKAIGTRISASSAESRSVMISAMKTTTIE